MRLIKIAIIKKIKEVINDFVSHPPKFFTTTFSIYLSKRITYDYTYMAQLFSKSEGKTIERYLMEAKIRTVKKLIRDGDLTLTEIAMKQHYCSLPHLCHQFKKITGNKLSDFRKNQTND